MSVFEKLLFGWLGMALIRLVITFATILSCTDGIFKQRIDSRSIILGILWILIVLFIWPKALFKERLMFFKYPNEEMKRTFLAYNKFVKDMSKTN
jgi:hypothetical protein